MIRLTRLNSRPLVVNADLIKFIEQAPDTVLTLTTGEKLVVGESVDEVLNLIRKFHAESGRRIAAGPEPAAGGGEAEAAEDRRT